MLSSVGWTLRPVAETGWAGNSSSSSNFGKITENSPCFAWVNDLVNIKSFGATERRSVVNIAQALRPALPENVKPLSPRPLFLSRFGTAMTSYGFKTAWQRAMQAYAQDGYSRFWEHDIRAKTASDMEDITSAQSLLGHESPTTTKRHYRRAPTKVRPLR